MKHLALIFACLMTLLAHAEPANELEQFGEQMAYFYLSPTRESFEEFQKRAEKFAPQLRSSGNGADLLTAVMIGKASQVHGWPLGNGPLAKTAREISKGQSQLARYVADDDQVDPTKLDIWWASFFATGDTRFLEKILQFAGQESPKGDVGRMLVVGAATWSFKANCGQHLRVLDFARQKLASMGEGAEKAAFLRDCIAYGEAPRAQAPR